MITLKKLFSGRIGRRLTALGLSLALAVTCIPFAGAITQSELDNMKKQQAELKSQVSDVQSQIRSLEKKEDTALEQVKLYQQQMDLIATQIGDTEALIDDYEVQIAQTQVELDEARQKAESYYQLFCERVRDMEESGGVSYWSILFDAASFSDLLDRITFIGDVVRYDNSMVDALEAARQEVADKETQLQTEKASQEAALVELESQHAEIEDATARTESLLEEIKANQAKYADQLEQLQSEQQELADDIASGQDELDAIRRAEEERKKAEEAAKKNNSNNGGSNSGGGSSVPPANVSGSGLGVDIANYACQFVGKLPYVWGGTSLTTGADCSGFVQAVFKQFGIYLPRTSHAQAKCGYAVSYADAQPGDLIYYNSSASASGGHIGIYIGNGQYVNAVGAKYGTRISYVNTGKSGLTFRRVI